MDTPLEMQADTAQWQSLADDLGLLFTPGFEGLAAEPRILKLGGIRGRTFDAEADKIRETIENPLFRELINKLVPGSVGGTFDGFLFHIYPSTAPLKNRKKSESTVIIVLLFPQPLKYGLKIKRSNFWHRIVKTLFGSRYIRFPDDDRLDKKLVVKGLNPEQITRALHDRSLCAAIAELVDAQGVFSITDDGISWTKGGIQIIDKEEALTVMQRMVKVASAFS